MKKLFFILLFLFSANLFAQSVVNIDIDGDGLIEIDNLEDLNAIRYQPDGTGYRTSTGTAIITTGCKTGGCNGYELTRDLDFNDDASYLDLANKATWTNGEGWQPIGIIANFSCQDEDSRCFAAIFEGNGYTVSNLTINRPDTRYVGLFANVERGSEIKNIGLLNVDIKGNNSTGGLAGRNYGNIAYSYATGSVVGAYYVGGLVGWNSGGSIVNSYAAVSVIGNGSIGGLVGRNSRGSIANSYATGSVDGGDIYVGGLVGNNQGSLVGNNKAVITNSYATGSVIGGTSINTGGLAGSNRRGNITNSYWDTETTGILTGSRGEGKTTSELKLPTSATGIYSEWSADNWDFGSASQYPVLKDASGNLLSPVLRHGLSRLRLAEGNWSPDFIASQPNYTGTVANMTNTIQLIPTAINPAARIRIKSGKIDDEIASGTTSSEIVLNIVGITTITIVVTDSEVTIKYNLDINYFRSAGEDIDKDGDGLIEIDNLQGLNAIRYQADGTGYRKTSTDPKVTTGCPEDGCKGYELTADLDLAKEDNWLPINAFIGIFEGNGHTISNLTINRPNTDYVGLFGDVKKGSEIKNIGLLNVDIEGRDWVGGLVGESNGDIMNSYTTGSVKGSERVGGLVGNSRGDTIANSYAIGSVVGNSGVGGLAGWNSSNITHSYAIGSVAGNLDIGGLVGYSWGTITNSYAIDFVKGSKRVGGLAGSSDGSITNSYAVGSVVGVENTGGLVGRVGGGITNSYAVGSVVGVENTGGLVGQNFSGSIASSYWDTDTAGILTSDGGTSKTTVELQSPTTATAIYSAWSSDNWDFGTSKQLPILKYNDACTTAAEAHKGVNPICGTFLPNQGIGLRTLEVSSASHVVRLVPVFSSDQSEYTVFILPGTGSINLRLKSYDAAAALEIKKQGEDTNYFTRNDQSNIQVSDGEIVTIQVIEMGTNTTMTIIPTATTTTYTLRVSFPPITSPISVTEDSIGNTNDTVNEGSVVTLSTAAAGGSGGYQYLWTQTAGETLATTDKTTPTLSFKIPADFVKSADATTASVTFTVTVTDSRNKSIAESKTLTIMKQNNGHLGIEFSNKLGADGTTLIAEITEDDPDGHAAKTITYQWQEQTEGSGWSDIGESTSTSNYRILPAVTDINYRVEVSHTDNQGYLTTTTTGSYQYEAPEWEISVNEDGVEVTDDEVDEGREVTLKATNDNNETYSYEWLENVLKIPNSSAAALSFKIPDGFVKSTDATTASVTFTVMVTDSRNNAITLDKTLTIAKQNNGILVLELDEESDMDGTTLTVVITADDPDGYDANAITYQWQEKAEGSEKWMNIAEAETNMYKVLPALTDIDYRVEVSYTDNQGYSTRTTTEAYQYEAPEWEISVTEDGEKVTNDTVHEGSSITLKATNDNNETYSYEWVENVLKIPNSSAAALRFDIPDDFIKSVDATTASVTFTVTVTDSRNKTIAESKTLTIEKQDNGILVLELKEESDMDGTTLTASVRTADPDGGQDANTIDYQWQERTEGSENWMNIASAANTKTYAVLPRVFDVDYRVRIDYMDNQGYSTRTTTGSYQYEAPKWEISVAETAEDGTMDTDNMVDEGNKVTLTLTVTNTDDRDETYKGYEWEQTAGETLSITDSMTDALSFTIPPDFIKSTTTTRSDVTFMVTVTDSRDKTTTETKILTIVKQPNGTLAMGFEEEFDMSGTTLTASVTTPDPDGYDPATIDYQWYRQVGDSTRWDDIPGDEAKTNIYKVLPTVNNINYRLEVIYTDNQSYNNTTMTGIYPYQASVLGISVAEMKKGGTEENDNMVDEGNKVTLTLTVTNTDDRDETYKGYEWEQTAGETLSITDSMTDALSFTIPPDFIKSTTTTRSDVTFMVTVTDSRDKTTTETKILTIVKQPNGTLAMGFEEEFDMSGTTLTASVTTPDPDGYDPATIDYQWYRQVGDSTRWDDIPGDEAKTNIYKVLPTVNNINYRLEVIYTDNQGYNNTTMTGIYPYQASVLGISVAEMKKGGTEENDNMVDEGNKVTLTLTVTNTDDRDETYKGYEWEQTAGETLSITDSMTDALSFTIPPDFIKSTTTTRSDVTFMVTVTDSRDKTTTETKILTIEKQNNGNLVAELEEGSDTDDITLTAVVTADDPDGGHDPDTITYQWQEKSEGSEWMPIASAANTKTYTVMPRAVDVDYRVRIDYTDNQGYTTMTTTNEYQYRVLRLEISVTEVKENGMEDSDDMVYEGSRVTLLAIGSGGSENYNYQWMQTPANIFTLPTTSIDEFGFDIPYTFIKSATTTKSSITFTVEVTDSRNNTITESKILTIEKQDNSDPMIEAVVDGTTLTAVVTDADDYDGDAENNAVTYQWQVRDGSSWMDVGEDAATYTKSSATDPNLNHRVIVDYTDDQGYTKQVEEIYPGAGIRIRAKVFLEGPLQ